MIPVDFDKEFFNTQYMPAIYRVVVFISPTKTNGLKQPYVTVVGSAKTVEDAKQLILDDVRDCAKTFGGLMAPISTSNRNYRIFKAEWSPVDPWENSDG